MSDDTEQYSLKQQLRNIASRVRADLTEKYIKHLIGYLRQRASAGYVFYTIDDLPDNICRDQLQEFFKQERMLVSGVMNGSITIRW